MAKRIVLCLDGTWNEEGQTDHGVEVETNVLKLYKALLNSPAQVDRYFAGVGTRPFEKVSGRAFGWDLFNPIKDAYRALIRDYDPGDEIFILGFSRGAYSARSLAGMVLRRGVLRKGIVRAQIEVDRPIARGSVIHASVAARLTAANVQDPASHGSDQPPPTLKLAPARQLDLARYTIEEP